MSRRNQSPALFAVALLRFAIATPLVHGQPESSGLVVYGRVCCTPTGNCPGGPGIPGVRVSMGRYTADGGYTVVDESMTGLSGTFSLVDSGFAAAAIISLTTPYTTTAVIPPAACSNLSTANLAGVPMHISTDVTPLLGLVGKYWVQWGAH